MQRHDEVEGLHCSGGGVTWQACGGLRATIPVTESPLAPTRPASSELLHQLRSTNLRCMPFNRSLASGRRSCGRLCCLWPCRTSGGSWWGRNASRQGSARISRETRKRAGLDILLRLLRSSFQRIQYLHNHARHQQCRRSRPGWRRRPVSFLPGFQLCALALGPLRSPWREGRSCPCRPSVEAIALFHEQQLAKPRS